MMLHRTATLLRRANTVRQSPSSTRTRPSSSAALHTSSFSSSYSPASACCSSTAFLATKFAARAFHTTPVRRADDPLKADLAAKGIPIPKNMPPSRAEFLEEVDKESKRIEKLMGTTPLPEDGIYDYVKKIGDMMLSLNALESQMLGKYLRKRLNLPDNPMAAMSAMGMGGMGMGGMGGMPPGAMMQQQAAPAAQPAAAAAAQPAAAAAAAPKEEAKAEKTEFNLKLEKFAADKKLQLIKELRVANKELGIKEAKELVESAPCILLKGLKKDDAAKWKTKFEELGGTISLE